MIKLNDIIATLRRLKHERPISPVTFVGVTLLVAALFYGAIGTSKLSIAQMGGKTRLSPDAPILVLPSIPKAPTDKPIAAIPSPSALTPAAKPQSIIVPAPSSSVDSLKPASTSTTTTTTTTSSSSGGSTNNTVTSGYTSTNWSGYVATSGHFTSIAASWVVPQPTGNGSTTTADATWVGIGGVTTSDLIQVGTDNTVDASGKVTSTIFYELLPAAAQIVTNFTVKPGDSIHASLSGSGNSWTITASDLTTGQTFTTVVSYASSLSSAEWIEEDPSYSSTQLVPFDNFGTVNISGGSTVNGGVSMNLAAAGVQPITLVNSSGQVLARPSALTSDGAGFSVTRY